MRKGETMHQLIAGNWKMNLLRAEAAALARDVAERSHALHCDMLICPPFTALAVVGPLLNDSRITLGAQDCHWADNGAYTGDIAAPMLADAGCSSVIVGHSERRQFHAETSAVVRRKAEAACAAGLTPIICVGETDLERDAGRALEVVCGQVGESVPHGFEGAVAYEPVWAIGTGRTPTRDDVAAMHGAIRRALVRHLGADGGGLRILYGGSVKPENAAELLAVPDVGGALIGGASLDAHSFIRIAQAARRG